MCFLLFVIVDTDKEESALIVAQAVIVSAISDLIQSAPGTIIPFQFDDHGWILMPDWYK